LARKELFKADQFISLRFNDPRILHIILDSTAKFGLRSDLLFFSFLSSGSCSLWPNLLEVFPKHLADQVNKEKRNLSSPTLVARHLPTNLGSFRRNWRWTILGYLLLTGSSASLYEHLGITVEISAYFCSQPFLVSALVVYSWMVIRGLLLPPFL
jgi:hypothetical protein